MTSLYTRGVDGDPTCAVGLGSAPFLGRTHELAVLRAARDAARDGAGRLVLVGGEPGIGKTRLAAVVAAEAAALGMVVWSARCWEGGSAPAFWPWNAARRPRIDVL